MAREHDDHVTEEDFMGDENIHHEGGEYGDEGENSFGSDWDEEGEGHENEEEETPSEDWGEEGGEEEGEYPEGEEGETEEGEAESQDEEKKPWKKYGIIGAAVVLLGGAATWVMGGYQNNQTPPQVAASHIKPGLKKPVPAFNNQTAQNTNNGFPAVQKPVVAPGAQITPPNQGPSVQPPSIANNQQAFNGPDAPPPIPGPSFNQNNGPNGFTPPNGPYGNGPHPGMGNHNPDLNGGVYDNDQGLSPYQRHQIENDASNIVLRTITKMGKSIHEDIHKTSDDEKALINKRIDELQALIMKRLDAIAAGAAAHGDSSAPAPSYSNPAPAPAPAVSEASRDQIEGIRDTLSAMRMTLESSNTAQKGQQDTIAALRSEIETLRGNQDSAPHSYARPAPVKHKAPPRHVEEDTSSSDDAPAPAPKPAPVKKISANWKLRGYNSSNNTVVLQSPKGDYYEESIGYLAKDDGGKDLGIGKLKSIEKQDSGAYVLHTSLGDIQQGH